MNLPFPVPEKLPKGVSMPTWVVLDVQGKYPTRTPGNPVLAAMQRTDSLESFDRRIDALIRAPWLHGVIVRVGELGVELAKAWHLARSLKRLSAEKRTVAFTTRLDMLTLLVASSVREVAVPESAELSVTGFTSEVTFYGALLKKHGVRFEDVRVREYKSALARFRQESMDAYDREQREALLASVEASWVRDVADARGVTGDDVLAWLAEGITSARRAREVGMVDRIAYEDELVGPATRAVASVAPSLKPARKASPEGRVAVVPVHGVIVPGRSRNNPVQLPLLGGPMAGADTVVWALRRAEKDRSTRAIVLHVDSPGGSALASDLIWREVQRCRKPVVAVFGDVAASGGYYVSAGADRIVAAPMTITGSIGVVSGKPVLEEFNERQGINPERVTRSAFPGLTSASRPWDERERALMEQAVQEIYERFTARVAEGRGMTRDAVDAIGRGRVWSGADALDLGLVDELGDVNTGVERACELAGLPFGAPSWTVEVRGRLELPDVTEPAASVLSGGLPVSLLRERAWVWLDAAWRVRG